MNEARFFVVKRVIYDKAIKTKKGQNPHLWRVEIWDGQEPAHQATLWKATAVGDVIVLYGASLEDYEGRNGKIKQWKYKRSDVLSPPPLDAVKEAIENSISNQRQKNKILKEISNVEESQAILKAMELGVDIGIFLNALKKSSTNIKRLAGQIKSLMQKVITLLEELERCL